MKKPKKLSTFDNLCLAMRELATSAACGCAYHPHWTPEFCLKENMEVWKDQEAPMRRKRGFRLTSISFWRMTPSEMAALGFGRWDSSGLRLIPLWAWNYIADGQRLTSISGETGVKGKDDLGLDIRFGCIAWGFAPKKAKRSAL